MKLNIFIVTTNFSFIPIDLLIANIKLAQNLFNSKVMTIVNTIYLLILSFLGLVPKHHMDF